MKLFLNNTSFLVSESLSKPLVALDEIDSIAQSIKTNMSKDITIPKDVLDSFKIKDSLNPEIWTGNVINPKITKKLIKIATDFFKDLNLPKQVLIKDIIFTGSLANFNWSKYSDIDLHIVLDFNQFDADPKMIESYFNAQKSIWNQEHDISVFNYPVELYIQDSKTKLRATSIYSLLKNKWVLKPKREQFQLDKKAIKDKADLIIFKLRDIRQDYNDHQYQSVVNKVTQLKHRIKRMRNSGLEKGGELSQENLVFKILRRTPFLDQLDSFRGKAYDKIMSVSETLNESPINQQDGVVLLKGRVLDDGTQRLYAAYVKYTSIHNRLKVGDEPAQPVKMVSLNIHQNIYRLVMDGFNLKALGVGFGSPVDKEKSLGIKGNNIGINNNKTPLHWETLQFTRLSDVLNKVGSQILRLPGIKWVG